MPHIKPTIRPTCDTCSIKIPKMYSLTCCLCLQVKHLKCQGLTKADAKQIWPTMDLWSCKDCNTSIFPLGIVPRVKVCKEENVPKFKSKCAACNGYSYKAENVRTCCYCDSTVHKKCWRDTLGCVNCCLELIPGYLCQNAFYELFDTNFSSNNAYYNPYNNYHHTRQIGDKLDDAEQNVTVWNDISDFFNEM